MTNTTPSAPGAESGQPKSAANHGFVPFPNDRATRYRHAGYWTGRTVDSLLRDTAAVLGDRSAVVDDLGTLTYRELDAAADRAARGFADLGITPGDRVLLQLPNRSAFAVALFGLLRAGAVPVMCLPGHRGAELSHFLKVSDAVALVIADTAGGFDYRSLAAELAHEHPRLRHVVVDGDPGPFTSWTTVLESLVTPPRPADVDTAGPALLLVSGGTTAAPKLIARTHDDYVYNAVTAARICGLTSDDVYLVVLPAGHNFPLACPGLLGAIGVGATTIFTTDPSPETTFDIIDRHRVTVTALVPSLAQLWTQATEWEPVRPESLRLLQVGGAKLTPTDSRQARERLTAGVQQVFGMAEGLVCFTRPGDLPEIVDNSQGLPMSEADEVILVDEDGTEVPDGQSGELLVRGPYTLNGYYRAEEDNLRAFTPDGFYRSGDRARRLPNGYLEVTGRVKDVIIRGGESIAALDLETHLQTHSAIVAAAAIGLPDQVLGEIVCAAVIFNGPAVELRALNDYLSARGAATHARVDKLVSLPSLPTTAVGKIDKRALAAQLAP